MPIDFGNIVGSFLPGESAGMPTGMDIDFGSIFSGGGGASFPPWLRWVMLGLGGTSVLSNILAERERSKLRKQATRLSAAPLETRPLEAGLVEGAKNLVWSDLAQRGLAQAPGIAQQQLVQAIAPLLQAERDRAVRLRELQLQAILGQAGLIPQAQSSAALWALILGMFKRKPKPLVSGVPVSPPGASDKMWEELFRKWGITYPVGLSAVWS